MSLRNLLAAAAVAGAVATTAAQEANALTVTTNINFDETYTNGSNEFFADVIDIENVTIEGNQIDGISGSALNVEGRPTFTNIIFDTLMDVVSFDISRDDSRTGGLSFTFRAFDENDNLLDSEIVSLLNTGSFSTYTLLGEGIKKFQILTGGSAGPAYSYKLDNIIGEAEEISAVPIPASLPLLATGLVSLALLGRGRKSTPAPATPTP